MLIEEVWEGESIRRDDYIRDSNGVVLAVL